MRLAPKNFRDIQRHFDSYKLQIQNKLTCAYKKRVETNLEIARLEKELSTCNDGIEWCEEVSKAGKGV